jgi:type VI secretion system protein
MPIEITITHSPASVHVSQPSFSFPDEGGTLGRANSNFWVLEDPNKYMSSVHAHIASESGQYFLTDMSTNGTFINGASEPVGNGNKVLLNDGDSFTISDYEFVVNVNLFSSATAEPLPTFPNSDNSDPFAHLSQPSAESSFPQASDNDPFANQGIFAESNNEAGFPQINDNDPFANPSLFEDTSNEGTAADFPLMSESTDPFAHASVGGRADDILPSVNTDKQKDPIALLDKTDPASNQHFSTDKSTADLFSSNHFESNHFETNSFSEPETAENSGVMNDSIDWPAASPESQLIPDDWNDDLGFADAETLPEIDPIQPPAAHFAPPETAFMHSESPLAENGFPKTPTSNVSPVAEMAPVDDPFAGGFPDSASEPLRAVESEPSIAHQQAFESEPAASTASDLASFATAAMHSPKPNVKPEVEVAPITAAVSATYSEAEYLALEQKNAQLQSQIADLKMQLEKASQVKAAPTIHPTDNNNAALNLIVDAMGLSKWNLSYDKKIEINETVGLLMRETMQGMMQVLKFRKKIKEEFRINVTTIQSVENNPLKFSANIDDALENMFIKDNNAYKKPVDAVKEGFQGIAEHQVAVVAGMQAAFRGMIERFDPKQLEKRFEKYKSASLLNLGKKNKHWNDYKEYHQGLVENLDDSFQHLFGYDFVQAYEEQMNSLISARVTQNLEKQQTQ